MCGMSMSGFSGGCWSSVSEFCVMLMHRSPMRSSSPLIFVAATINLKSLATGCWVARSVRAYSSISISRRFTSCSYSRTLAAGPASRWTSTAMALSIMVSASAAMWTSFFFRLSSSLSNCRCLSTSVSFGAESAPWLAHP